jgi:DNA polymerase II large subunit
MTVHEASVVKYLNVTKMLVDKYNVDDYTRQRVEMAERDINSLFTNDHAKQSSLLAFDESIKVDPGRDGKKGKKRKGKGRT